MKRQDVIGELLNISDNLIGFTAIAIIPIIFTSKPLDWFSKLGLSIGLLSIVFAFLSMRIVSLDIEQFKADCKKGVFLIFCNMISGFLYLIFLIFIFTIIWR